MSKYLTLYEKYGKYFLTKFENNNKLKFDIVKNDNESFGVYIFSNSDFSEYFLRIEKEMIYIDGIVVQDIGMEFEDISNVDEKDIFTFLDEQAKILDNFLNNGINLYAFKNGTRVLAMSTDVTDREKLFQNFDIKTFYNSQCSARHPKFEELTKIELLDFYGDVVYEYTQKTID